MSGLFTWKEFKTFNCMMTIPEIKGNVIAFRELSQKLCSSEGVYIPRLWL